jgi:hypothetical protein
MTKTKRDFHYDGFSTPNGTLVPDDVFDVLLPELRESELRVLLYIIRRTFGFKKDSDSISLSQMVGGIRTRDGRVLDRGTGMTRRGVLKGVAGLNDKGVIRVERGFSANGANKINAYSLRFKDQTHRGVGNKVPHGRERRSPPLGNVVPPQTTVLQQTVRQDNVDRKNGETKSKPAGQIDYLVAEIEKVTGDTHSHTMFRFLAAALPDELVFQLLSEIKQGQDIRNKGAVFVTAAKKRLEGRKAGG